MRRMAVILGALLCFAASQRADAYVVGTCAGVPVERSNHIPQFRANAFTGDDPPGQFTEALAIFNRNPTIMRYLPSVDFDINHAVALNNGHTEVWTTIDPDLFNGDNFAAVGYYYLDGCTIDEGDVVFNAAFSWNQAHVKADYNAYGDDSSDISSLPAAIHELGHTVAFGHDPSTYNIMGDAYRHFWANGADAGVYLGEGVIDGLIALYGDEFPPVLQYRDVAVTHWQYESFAGEYSVHARTAIFDLAGDELAQVPGEAEPRYIAAAGQAVEAFFTFENLGHTLEEGVSIGFYYSDDDTITTMDRRLGGASLDFIRNDPDTRRFPVDLPVDLPQGDGYLGIIVDETDSIAEGFESNNASYIGLRIDGVDLDGDGEPDDGSETFYQYAAKVVCGRQNADDDLRLRTGTYATTVNVLNPGRDVVRFRKQLAVSFPPDPQLQGETYDFGFDSLDPIRALETNCDDLIEKAFAGVMPEPYFEGFVVITSPASLDVTAVYTSSPPLLAAVGAGPGGFTAGESCKPRRCRGCCDCCDCCGGHGDPGNGDPSGGFAGAGASIDVEQIRERLIEGEVPEEDDAPDLVPARPFPGDGSQPGDHGYCLANPDHPLAAATRIRVIIRNAGDADAGLSVTAVRFGRNGEAAPPLSAELTANTPVMLAPGAETSHEFQIPSACYGQPGTGRPCRFTVTADAAMPDDVEESNEANNSDASQCLSPTNVP